MEKLSVNITIKEATFSQTAIQLGIVNEPDAAQMRNMTALATNIFEPLRKGLGDNPIHISSFFRCKKLNDAVGGASNSQHVSGQAMDIDNDSNPSNKEIFEYIRDNMEFDQLINEFPDQYNNPSWVHVSWNETNNRGNVLTSQKINGETTYSQL